MDVLLDRARLRDARDTLKTAKSDFDDAASINDALEDAIGNPQGKSKLRDRVGWFEANWSGNRDDLKESIENVYKRLDGIIDGWDEWEAEASASLEGKEGSS
ncbi:hypothetical protein FVO59_07495 [Microbacterium esteraromaticum]|uniref:Uncharacterized protein n=1 Tax=Microbacterium esteraromaticum TaxID=57043 RepID=A0A7D8AJF4_9MICO|nr:hypothetical protein [Microbacterium esteraromaticum]QMU97086.1 hypothetical protein FVO59_07495 [Microbacterium esteraromaticum]